MFCVVSSVSIKFEVSLMCFFKLQITCVSLDIRNRRWQVTVPTPDVPLEIPEQLSESILLGTAWSAVTGFILLLCIVIPGCFGWPFTLELLFIAVKGTSSFHENSYVATIQVQCASFMSYELWLELLLNESMFT